MVGASSIENDPGTEGKAYIGIILMLCAMCIQAAQMIIEEKLFRTYYLSPLKVVGFQGMFGIGIYLIFLPIAYFIKCGGRFCPSGRVEDSIEALQGMKENKTLLFLVIALMVDISIYNALGNSVTKYASWANRATVNTVKVVLVWSFFLLYPGQGHETFHLLQLGGFILIVIGTFIFNFMKDKQISGREKSFENSIESFRKLKNNVNKSSISDSKQLTSIKEAMLVSI